MKPLRPALKPQYCLFALWWLIIGAALWSLQPLQRSVEGLKQEVEQLEPWKKALCRAQDKGLQEQFLAHLKNDIQLIDFKRVKDQKNALAILGQRFPALSKIPPETLERTSFPLIGFILQSFEKFSAIEVRGIEIEPLIMKFHFQGPQNAMLEWFDAMAQWPFEMDCLFIRFTQAEPGFYNGILTLEGECE